MLNGISRHKFYDRSQLVWLEGKRDFWGNRDFQTLNLRFFICGHICYCVNSRNSESRRNSESKVTSLWGSGTPISHLLWYSCGIFLPFQSFSFFLTFILIKFVITLLIEFWNIHSNSFFAEEHNKGTREKCLHLFQTPAMQSTENFNRNVI